MSDSDHDLEPEARELRAIATRLIVGRSFGGSAIIDYAVDVALAALSGLEEP